MTNGWTSRQVLFVLHADAEREGTAEGVSEGRFATHAKTFQSRFPGECLQIIVSADTYQVHSWFYHWNALRYFFFLHRPGRERESTTIRGGAAGAPRLSNQGAAIYHQRSSSVAVSSGRAVHAGHDSAPRTGRGNDRDDSVKYGEHGPAFAGCAYQ